MVTPEHTQLLLVEDDPNFGAVLKDYLELHDYEVTLCTDGLQGLRTFQKNNGFDACILDVMMPFKDGFSLAADIKKINPQVPLVFLTAKAMKADMLEGFRLGADDYITKPFDSEILLCKLKAILQRKQVTSSTLQAPTPSQYTIGQYTFHYKTREIHFQGQVQRLSPKEAELLALLCQHLNDVLPRELALQKIWSDDNYFTARSMDVFITKLRKYLKADTMVEIINVHGNGFLLIAPTPIEAGAIN